MTRRHAVDNARGDEAGAFLTRFGAYEDGMALYRTAVKRYPCYCKGSAIAAVRQVCTKKRCRRTCGHWNWNRRIRETLERAVSMDPDDELAKENLDFCRRTQPGHDCPRY